MKFKKIFLFFIVVILLINIFPFKFSYATELSANSEAVILVNSNTGKIMYEKNAYKTMYPASTTKIMTAILAIENCDLFDTATVSENAVKLPKDYVGMAPLQLDEEITIKDLLYLLLLVSSNDGAVVLAEHIAGSVENFAKMMNDKATQIGCSNTHFVTPNGVHDDNHYTTAYDLSLITQYAMKNDTFREIVSTSEYMTSATNKAEERDLYNTNMLLHPSRRNDENEENVYYCKEAIGIKTGYTKQGKNCLVAAAKKDDTEYIAVILGSAENERFNNSERYADAKNLFLTVFDNYSLNTVKKAKDVITTVEIPNGDFIRKNLKLVLENNIEIVMSNSDISTDLEPEIVINKESISAPISKGDVLGTVTYVYDGKAYTSNIIAANSVCTDEQMNTYLEIAVILIACLIIFIAYKLKNREEKLD